MSGVEYHEKQVHRIILYIHVTIHCKHFYRFFKFTGKTGETVILQKITVCFFLVHQLVDFLITYCSILIAYCTIIYYSICFYTLLC